MKTELGTEFVFHRLTGWAAASPRTLIALFLPLIMSRYSSVAATGNNGKKQGTLALKISVNNFEVSSPSETCRRVEQCKVRLCLAAHSGQERPVWTEEEV